MWCWISERAGQPLAGRVLLLLLLAYAMFPAMGRAEVDPPAAPPAPAATAPEQVGQTAGEPKGRFFLMGSGILSLHNLRNDRQSRVELLAGNGRLDEEAMAKVDWLFDYPPSGPGDHISPRLLFMLSYFADQVAPGKTIFIESAYRSPEYNEQLRRKGANAARTSTHLDGLALDFWIEGVDGKGLWETVRAQNCCGVGHYGDKTIHLDAGRPRFWEAATSGTGSREPDYNRHVTLSALYDRYAAGEELSLSLSGISTFGFGVQDRAQLVRTGDPAAIPVALLPLQVADGAEPCRAIADRRTSRRLTTFLPASLAAGRYQLQVGFCRKPFPQMPDRVVSREFEVVR